MTNTDAAPSDRFDVWRERVRGLLHPMDVQPGPVGDPAVFAADFRAVRAATASAAVGHMSPVHTAVRKPHADCADPDKVQLFVGQAGGGVHHSRGRTWTHSPNTLLIECPDEVRAFNRTHRSQFCVLEVSIAALSIPPAAVRRHAFQPIPLPREVVRLFTDSVVHAVGLSPLQVASADRYLSGVADIALRTALEKDADHHGTADARRLQVTTYMQRHLHDPSMTAESVAAAVSMSRRTLFNLFADDDTPMATLRRMRIGKAKDLLTAQPSMTVSEVARRSGFSGAEQFARAFRRHAGMSPSDYRRSSGAAKPHPRSDGV